MNHVPTDSTPSSLRPLPPISAGSSPFDGDDPTWAIAAARRRHFSVPQPEKPDVPAKAPCDERTFWPEPPHTFDETGLRTTQVESLILKYLLNLGNASGREIANQIALPYRITQQLLFGMKEQQLLSLKSDAPLGDYSYELTEFGADYVRDAMSNSARTSGQPPCL